MRPNRSSLRIRLGGWVPAVGAAIAVGLCTACGGGGGGASTPTATTALSASPAAAPAATPQRAPLASPVASPSAIASTNATPTTTTGTVAGGETYEVQSGDTLLTIAQQYYQDGSQWRRIYDANKDTIGADPDKLKVGMKLTIPPKQS